MHTVLYFCHVIEILMEVINEYAVLGSERTGYQGDDTIIKSSLPTFLTEGSTAG